MNAFATARLSLRIWIVGFFAVAALLLASLSFAPSASATEEVPCGSFVGEVTVSTPFSGDGSACFGPGGTPNSVLPVSLSINGFIAGSATGALINTANEEILFTPGDSINFPNTLDIIGVRVDVIVR